MAVKERLSLHLEQCRTLGLYRKRDILPHSAEGARWNFASNDYLSLTQDLRVQQAFQRGYMHYPSGSGASMLGFGYHANHVALERAFAEALNVEDCLLFSSGYAANLSVAHLLKKFAIHALIDKSVHASVYDGLQGSGVTFYRFFHNNLDDLETKLVSLGQENSIVLLTESVFSMSGQSAPLSQINACTMKYGAEMIVDEAHAFGVFGKEGLGMVLEQGLTQKEVPLRVIPLGKAYGASGAIVAGDGVWIDALLQVARSYIYSTAMSPAMAYGLLETLTILRAADERRAKLRALVHYFHQAIASSPLTWCISSTPIQHVQLGCPIRALEYAKKLRQRSIFVLPVREPTVSKKETGLRIVLNYQHEPEDIDYLFRCLDEQ